MNQRGVELGKHGTRPCYPAEGGVEHPHRQAELAGGTRRWGNRETSKRRNVKTSKRQNVKTSKYKKRKLRCMNQRGVELGMLTQHDKAVLCKHGTRHPATLPR